MSISTHTIVWEGIYWRCNKCRKNIRRIVILRVFQVGQAATCHINEYQQLTGSEGQELNAEFSLILWMVCKGQCVCVRLILNVRGDLRGILWSAEPDCNIFVQHRCQTHAYKPNICPLVVDGV